MHTGRFAPTPSGELHFGSLCTALGSYLRARSLGGRWLVRIEDLDQERCRPEHTDSILRVLEAHGLEYDGEVICQSRRRERYLQVLAELRERDLVYPCSCSRKRIRELGGIYDGCCRNGAAPGAARVSMRFRNPGTVCDLDDVIRGRITADPRESGEDFILLRSDGTPAYNLASVVDDHDQGVTEIVRGADLLPVAPRQMNLMHVLGYPVPGYLHLPLILADPQHKYSKQNLAPPVSPECPGENLIAALRCLGQKVPDDLIGAPPEELLRHTVAAFTPYTIPTEDIIIPPGDMNSSRR